MTTQELRIAKLSKVLNSSMLDKNSKSPVIKDAFNRAFSELQRSINLEKAFNSESEERHKIQSHIERQEAIIKENMRKHHFVVLKKQIEDRKRQKDIGHVEKLIERPKAPPKTPPEQPKFYIRENLKDQIKEKRRNVKNSQKNELDVDRFMIKLAKTSLDEDIKKKKQEKEQIYNELKQSWEDAITLSKMQKQAERLKFFGNNSLRKNFKQSIFRRSKPSDKPDFNNEDKKQSQSLLPDIHKHPRTRTSEASPTHVPEKPNKTFHSEAKHKHSLPAESSPVKSADRSEIMARLDQIKQEEARIKNNKLIIMEYLTARAKSKS